VKSNSELIPFKAKNKKIDLDDEEILSEEADGLLNDQYDDENEEEGKEKFIYT
jgi:hypothetical protein